MSILVKMLGRLRVEVEGREVGLPPKAMEVLACLVLAEGESVMTKDIFRTVWSGRPDNGLYTVVHQRIRELRQELGVRDSLVTEDRSYRLRRDDYDADVFQFRDLVHEGLRAAPMDAIDVLTRALALWGGPPLRDLSFATATARGLEELRAGAGQALFRSYAELNMIERAIEVGEGLLIQGVGSAELAEDLDRLRERLRSSRRTGQVLRRESAALQTSITVVVGDLFEQHDANLVVGFSDTFDTVADGVVISAQSVQGQLVDRLYGGDAPRLGREISAALRRKRISPVAEESRQAKPHGRRKRYPIGTVATLRAGNRCVFAVAYSRMTNDLLAESDLAGLGHSLDRLWDAARLDGQLRPLAIPLVGSGLARIPDATPGALLRLIVQSYVARAEQQPFSTELRIVLRQGALERIALDLIRSLTDLPEFTNGGRSDVRWS
ncbi:macro domain-containing protein [Herbidospora galbida]|nr:macro domain-containing protein [Herbidospora galbida]